MRVFPCLMKKVMPNGHIFIGRHHLQYAPDARVRDRVRWRLQVEEQNMLYLRHPYLTVEQSRKHMEHEHKNKFAAIIDAQKRQRMMKWFKPVRLEDKLNHLRHSESWE